MKSLMESVPGFVRNSMQFLLKCVLQQPLICANMFCGRVLDSFVGAWGERCGELCGGGDDGEQCGELCGGEAIEVAEVRNHPRLIEGRY